MIIHSLRSSRSLRITALALLSLGTAAATHADDTKYRVEMKPRVATKVVVAEGDKQPEVFFWKDGEGVLLDKAFLAGRGYIGTKLTELTPELRRHFGGEEDRGVLVASVEEDSPAAKAGLAVGDVVVEVEGKAVRSSADIARETRPRKAGETVRIEVLRDGRQQGFDIEIAEKERKTVEFRTAMPELAWSTAMTEPMERAREILDDPAFQGRIQRIGERERELEGRLKELEARLKELEKLLEKGGR